MIFRFDEMNKKKIYSKNELIKIKIKIIYESCGGFCVNNNIIRLLISMHFFLNILNFLFYFLIIIKKLIANTDLIFLLLSNLFI